MRLNTRFLSKIWILLIYSCAHGVVAGEVRPINLRQVLAVENVCAWPNLTLLRDGTIAAILHNAPSHGREEADLECWVSRDGLTWEKRSLVTSHEPQTVRMNHAAGLARNGDFLVLCSGWTDVKQAERPKQGPFRDDVLSPWILRSRDDGRTWTQSGDFPAGDNGWTEYIPFGDIWTDSGGVLHTSCYQGKYTDSSASTEINAWRSWHFRSADDGVTWQRGSLIGAEHNETNIFPLRGSSWLAAARSVSSATDLFRSDDGGATWRGPRRVTSVGTGSGQGEINAHVTRLADNRLLLTYGVRTADKAGVCALLSADEGRTWTEPVRLVNCSGDSGYPSSVQLASGIIVTAWYAKQSPLRDGYHMGATVWEAPTAQDLAPITPAQPEGFIQARVTDTWAAYADQLSFGLGQTLALLDDGCTLSRPEWQTWRDGVPKVRVAYDAVSGDTDPKHEGRAYHGTTIGIPSSLDFPHQRGVAWQNQIAVVRSLECCHGTLADSAPLARALQWVIDHHEEHQITTVNLAPVDNREHRAPVPTEIDAKLARLRELGVWVSAPSGNHAFTSGISWPAAQGDCFAIGAVVPGQEVIHCDRSEKVALLAPATATSSANAIVCGAAMILREAIDKSRFDWRREGANLPDAMMNIFQRSGQPVTDPLTGRVYRRLDLLAAVQHVLGAAQ